MTIEERLVENVPTYAGTPKGLVRRWIEEKDPPARSVAQILRFKLSGVGRWVCKGSKQETASFSEMKQPLCPVLRRSQTGKTGWKPTIKEGRSGKSKKSKNG